MAHTFSHDEDATSRWGLIFHGSGLYRPGNHTRQEWAQIVDAVSTADGHQAWSDPTMQGPAPTRGDPVWCRVAVDTYDTLHAAGAYWHPRPGDRPECFADEHIIRAWLDAPWVPPGQEPMTMLQATGLDVQFEPDRAPDPTSLIILVDHAQQVGVLGADGCRVGLWRWMEQGEFRDGYQVTVRPLGGPGWASPRIDPDELHRVGDEPADAVVGVLTGVARVANTLLDTHVTATASNGDRQVPDRHVDPAPGTRRGPAAAADAAHGRAFPPPHMDTEVKPGTVHPVSGVVPIAPASPTSRHR